MVPGHRGHRGYHGYHHHVRVSWAQKQKQSYSLRCAISSIWFISKYPNAIKFIKVYQSGSEQIRWVAQSILEWLTQLVLVRNSWHFWTFVKANTRVGKEKHEETKPRSLPDASQCSAVFDFLNLSGSNWLLRQLPCSLHISFHASLNMALTNYKNIINISTLNLQPLDVDDVGLYHPDNQAVQNIWGQCSHLTFLYAQSASFILAVPASSYRGKGAQVKIVAGSWNAGKKANSTPTPPYSLSLPIAIYSLPVDLSMCQFVCLKSIRLELDKKTQGSESGGTLKPPLHRRNTIQNIQRKEKRTKKRKKKKNGTTCRLVLLFVSLFGVLLSLILAQHEQKKIRGFVISFDCGDALQNLRSESP